MIRLYKRYAIKRELLEENLLKAFYKIGERKKQDKAEVLVDNSYLSKNFSSQQLRKGLIKLKKAGYATPTKNGWLLTEEGFEKGKRITRLHRLWELYLTKYLRIAPDHVHEDAETIEHVLTPELEARLQQLLDFPTSDPHRSTIPQ